MYLIQPPYLLTKFFPKSIWRKSSSSKNIYLTFDDGPIPIVTPWVLSELKKHNIKATFFCVGKNVKENPAIYQQIIDEGHCIGNHSYDHLNGWKTDNNTYFENIEKCAKTLNLPAGEKLFRAPYGKIKRSQLKHLIKHYTVIMWDALSYDFDKKTSPEKCFNNIKNSLRNGTIIVFHDSIKAQKNLEYALPKVIEFAITAGYNFKALL